MEEEVEGGAIAPALMRSTSVQLLDMSRTAAELRRLIDTANAPSFGVDRGWCVTEWSATMAAITGY